MYIEKLDSNRILIVLGEGDISLLSPDKALPPDALSDAHRLFSGLIGLAAVKVGLSLKRRRISVSFLKGADTIFMIVYLYDIALLTRGHGKYLLCRFKKARDLLDCLDRLGITLESSKLYKLGGDHVLCLPDSFGSKRHILSEYASVVSVSKRKLLELEEYSENIT